MNTQFLTALSTHSDSFEAGKEAAEKVISSKKLEHPGNLLVLFSSDHYDYSAVLRGVKSVVGETIPIIGSSAAGIFSQDGYNRKGIGCALISSDRYRFFTGLATGLKSNPFEAAQHATHQFPQDVEGLPHQSAMLFIDGLVGKGEEAVLAVSSALGPLIKFAGGAAADSLIFKETQVFNNEQSLEDAISICLIASASPVVISVQHGHRPISPPLRVTKAEGNVAYEIEGRPALEVWKEHIKHELQEQGKDLSLLSNEEVSRLLLKYEAGLSIGNQEYKIRFPLSANQDGSLNFVCSIMEGAVIRIMDSEEKDQIESARKAAHAAIQLARGGKLAGAIIFDCACRAMILKEQFEEAVKAVKETVGPIPFLGCETYGEIAMEMGQLSGFHNTTTVIMLFPN
jgi:hypothetical protein